MEFFDQGHHELVLPNGVELINSSLRELGKGCDEESLKEWMGFCRISIEVGYQFASHFVLRFRVYGGDCSDDFLELAEVNIGHDYDIRVTIPDFPISAFTDPSKAFLDVERLEAQVACAFFHQSNRIELELSDDSRSFILMISGENLQKQILLKFEVFDHLEIKWAKKNFEVPLMEEGLEEIGA